MTIEELQAENVRLTDELKAKTDELSQLSETLKTTQTDLQRVRDVNQALYLRVQAQQTPKNPDPSEDDPVETCEDFAKKLDF